MVELNIKTSSHPYKVIIGEKLRHRLPEFLKEDYTSVFIITDSTIKDLYLKDVINSLTKTNIPVYSYAVKSGEQSKSIETYYKLQTKAIEYGLNRRSLIIALGGGVVGDLAGFVAATFMRGIDYIQVPTTILAHDSSVGGKVAINHELGKNMIGDFYPPKGVIYDVETLQSLSAAEVRSGYAEIVKEAFIAKPNVLHELLNYRLNDIDNQLLVKHLKEGISIKADIVQNDEHESGIRAFLNFGHTLGHAIEATIGYGEMTHGEAIAIGMIFALNLSEKYFNISLPINEYVSWLKRNDFPIDLTRFQADKLIQLMQNDKKVVDEKIPMILLEEIGKPAIVPFDAFDLQENLNCFLNKRW